MAVELPDPDLSVSFVVDDGEAVGPLTLSEIARSIGTGGRPADAYVWWSGAGEWMRFNADERLMALATDSPIVEKAAVETVAEPEEEAVVAEVAVETVAEPAEEVDAQPVLIDLTESVEAELEPEPVMVAASPEPEPVMAAESVEDSLDQITLTDNSVLADVGARLEALASATRHLHNTSKIDAASEAPALRLVGEDDQVDLRDPRAVVSTVRASTLETGFDFMVRQTENHSRLLDQAERVRELLARACGAAMSRQGYSVERRNQSAGSYFLGFESTIDSREMSLEISPAASVSEATGHHVHFSLSWGRPVSDLDDALAAVHAQLPVADRPLGVISSDAQIDTGMTSTRVELIWSIDEYIDSDFNVDGNRLENALDAIQQALENRWYELFSPAE